MSALKRPGWLPAGPLLYFRYDGQREIVGRVISGHWPRNGARLLALRVLTWPSLRTDSYFLRVYGGVDLMEGRIDYLTRLDFRRSVDHL